MADKMYLVSLPRPTTDILECAAAHDGTSVEAVIVRIVQAEAPVLHRNLRDKFLSLAVDYIKLRNRFLG